MCKAIFVVGPSIASAERGRAANISTSQEASLGESQTWSSCENLPIMIWITSVKPAKHRRFLGVEFVVYSGMLTCSLKQSEHFSWAGTGERGQMPTCVVIHKAA